LRSNPSQNYGPALILTAAILWGTTGTSQAFAPITASSLTIGAVRLVIGGLALLALALAAGDLHRAASWPILPTFAAALSIAAYQLFFFAALRRTGVAIGTLIAIGSAPLLAGLFAFAFQRQPIDRRWLLATLLAIAGLILLILPSQNDGTRLFQQIDPAGILLALGAGASYAIYTLATKRLLQNHPPGALAFCLGALLLSPLLLTGDLAWLAQPSGLLVALHLGLFATALAYALFTRGLCLTPAPTAVTLSLAEPLTASLLGLLLLGERLPALAFFGAGLLFAGLAVLALGRAASQ
jgi:DME family drug/metabolite transporter